jgi:chromosome segregation ATPase
MDKHFSTSEIIKASDDILNTPSKSSKINNIKITKNNYSSPLLLVNEISKNASPKANMSFINNLNKNNININEKIKNEIINELYNFFKKKIKKNTLKIIFDQQIEIKKFQKKIEYLNESKKILENNNHDLQSNLNQIIEDKKILENNNHDLQSNLNQIIEDKKILENNNHDLQSNLNQIIEDKKVLENNNHDLQSSLDKIIEEKEMLIEKNTRAQEELSLEKSNLLNNSNNEKLTELNNKLKFYQDENLRLSRDLSNSQETHHIIKKQLNDFEKQKNQISNQIQELNNSVSKSNLITPTFVNELPPEASQDLKNLNNQDMTNLNETIKKIFKKL